MPAIWHARTSRVMLRSCRVANKMTGLRGKLNCMSLLLVFFKYITRYRWRRHMMSAGSCLVPSALGGMHFTKTKTCRLQSQPQCSTYKYRAYTSNSRSDKKKKKMGRGWVRIKFKAHSTRVKLTCVVAWIIFLHGAGEWHLTLIKVYYFKWSVRNQYYCIHITYIIPFC